MSADPSQLDFWKEPVFPVRAPVSQIDIDRYRAKLKQAMSRAIRESQYDRPTIAARMARYLGLPSISKASIDAYTAESKTGHDITMPRFLALVHATGAHWLWDEAASIQGVTVLFGDEPFLAEIALKEQERRRLTAELKLLKARPIAITSRGRR
ncbi:hypothetical protein AKG11_28315 [Shinella sp. SUS2]|uniref:hypothetical protein n=1 Tax=unclassified Shinella TaxID=2643062 RepID=UPI0006817F89|nr:MULTISPECIES: hypothetical protein [unclassified Shinella]KNY13640.1 hypothetical protein AKG11_28315 [Shinella sp. SUS2]KOC72533.1 hypothetical protein AKG10_27180 [Shinella sp. GWS1]